MKPIVCGKFSGNYFIANRLGRNKGAVISKNIFDFLKKLSSENANIPNQVAIFLSKLGLLVSLSQKIDDLFVFLTPTETKPYGVISYEITERCNFSCIHCVLGKKKSKRELTIAKKREIIKRIFDSGCVYLKITGGEPLLATGFDKVYSFAHRLGLLVKIQTNGSLIALSKNQKLFEEFTPHKIVISLYGATKKSYETLTRSPGSFNKFLEAIKWLKNSRISTRINIIITSYNEHEVDEMVRMAKESNSEYFIYTRLTPTFQKETAPMNFMSHDCPLLNRVKRYNQESFARTPDEEFEQCLAGKSSFHVDSIGNVMICQSSRKKIFNLLKQNKDNFAELVMASDLLLKKPDFCQTCEFKKDCSICSVGLDLYKKAHKIPFYVCKKYGS